MQVVLMRKVVSQWTLVLSCLSGTALAQPVTPQDQQQWLLGQVRLGEAMNREDLVRDSLARLESIAPEHPQVLVGGIRQALLQHNQPLAEQRLEQLRRQAPGSPALHQAQALIKLQSKDGQHLLQQARLLAAAGRAEEAAAQYQELFGSEPPDFSSALEYWAVRSAISGQRPAVIQQLQSLDSQYPGNAGLRQMLAGLLFAEQRDAEALAVLHQLANDPQASNLASEREYNYLSKLPVSSETARAWEDFQRHYPYSTFKNQAAKQLQHQRQLLGDPAWRAGVKGKELLEANDNVGAEKLLRRASRSYPDDASLIGSLGIALMHQNKHDQAYTAFTEALGKEQDTSRISKWQDLQLANRNWMLLQQGDEALERKDLAAARKAYQQARQVKPDEADWLVGLASAAQAEGEDIQAEALLLQARKLQPDNGKAVRALVRLYQTQAPKKAQDYLDTLPAATQREFAALRRSLELDRLKLEADAATRRADWPTVSRVLLKARPLAPDDPWLTYRLANAQHAQGQDSAAEDSFRQLIQRQGSNAQARYAHGLYLASIGRDSETLATLAAIPAAQWDGNMRDLSSRVERRQLLARAQALRDAGHEPQAIALLLRAPSTDDLATLADWAYQRGDQLQAETYYRQVLQREPRNAEAQLGLIETLIARGQLAPAQSALEELAVPANAPAAYQRRLANAWTRVNQPDKARALYARLLETPQSDPLLYRDAARLMSRQQPQQALDNYARSMAAASLIDPAQANPRDDRAMTLASRAKDADEWLPRSLRSDVDTLYQEQNPTVHLYHDFAWRTDNSSSGISDLTTQTTILRLDAPIAEGQGFLQAERVELDVGSFATEANGLHREQFGSCALVTSGCPDTSESTSGTGLAMGWKNERWALDLGHSPEGFKVPNWLGGVTYSSDWRSLGWSLTASRRPMSNSLVSYAGAVDPITGITWGGVTANGVTLGLSHDEGGVDGVWASLGAHWLRGQNVADNQRRSAMAGYYYRLIDRADERLRTGLTLMYWGYDKDLSEYSLGQGGYYSPQQYYSIGVPLNYAWRNADWSVLLESSVGWSYAKTRDSDLYPVYGADKLRALVEQAGFVFAEDASQVNAGSSSSGVNVRLQGLFERRLSDNLVLGTGITWQHSEGYAPSRALLYLRYTFDPWQGNLPLPVEPIAPYADRR